jgi:hypothetical protein
MPFTRRSYALRAGGALIGFNLECLHSHDAAWELGVPLLAILGGQHC